MTTTQASSSLGLMASTPRRVALHTVLAPAGAGVLAHTLTLVTLVGVGIRMPVARPGELLADVAPLALALGVSAALAVIIARQLGVIRTRSAIAVGLATAGIPLAGLILTAFSTASTLTAGSPAASNDATRYLCLCLPFVALALVIVLGSARLAGRQGSRASRG